MQRKSVLFVAFFLLCAPFTVGAHTQLNEDLKQAQQEVDRVREQINNQRDSVSSLQDSYDLYTASLELEELELQRLSAEQEVVEGEISHLSGDIDELKEKQIRTTIALEQAIAESYQGGVRNWFELLFSDRSLSQMLNEIHQQEVVTNSVAELTSQLQIHRLELEQTQRSLQSEYDTLNALRDESKERAANLQARKEAIQLDAQEEQDTLEEFEKLLLIAEAELLSAEEALTKVVPVDDNKPIVQGDFAPQWPVTGRRITCVFKCEDYPFPWEHSGLDIGVPSGTPVYAAESGYITQRQFDGTVVTTGLLAIDHQNGYMTRYLHLSQLIAQPYEWVEKGEVIGYSGGGKGEPGAGASTGPHVHFEVRVDGIPVDPLNYLP